MSILTQAIIAARSIPVPPPALPRIPAPDPKELAFLRTENEVLKERIRKLEEAHRELSDASLGPVPGWDFDRPHIREIIIEVAKVFDVTPHDILSHCRMRKFARPRQVAMYLCRKFTLHSLPGIAKGFGNRDHTTVLLALRRIIALRAVDEQLNRNIIHLEYILRTKRDANEKPVPA